MLFSIFIHFILFSQNYFVVTEFQQVQLTIAIVKFNLQEFHLKFHLKIIIVNIIIITIFNLHLLLSQILLYHLLSLRHFNYNYYYYYLLLNFK